MPSHRMASSPEVPSHAWVADITDMVLLETLQTGWLNSGSAPCASTPACVCARARVCVCFQSVQYARLRIEGTQNAYVRVTTDTQARQHHVSKHTPTHTYTNVGTHQHIHTNTLPRRPLPQDPAHLDRWSTALVRNVS